MQEADIEAVSTVRVLGWKSAYIGMIPAAVLDGMNIEADVISRRQMFAQYTDTADNLVAEVDGSVVGWACLGPSSVEGAAPGVGELHAIYVLPEAIGTGVGRALIQSALECAAKRSYTYVHLWVLRDNVQARRVYAAAGFAPDGVEKDFMSGGVAVPEVQYAIALPPNGR